MAGGVGPSLPFMASGEGPLLPFVGGGVGPRLPLVHGGVGPLLPFVPGAVGPSSSFGLGPSFAMWCWALVIVHGWCCWGLVIFRGWRCWGLIILFMGGGGVPLLVFVCHMVLSPFEGEGGGWLFVFVGTPSIVVIIGIVLHRFCVLSLHVVLITCPRHCMSSSCCCPMPSLLLSHVAVVAMPLL